MAQVGEKIQRSRWSNCGLFQSIGSFCQNSHTKVKKALDKLNLKNIEKETEKLHDRSFVSLIQGLAFSIAVHELNIAKKIKEVALDVAVAMSVVDVVMNIIDIDFVKQTKKMVDNYCIHTYYFVKPSYFYLMNITNLKNCIKVMKIETTNISHKWSGFEHGRLRCKSVIETFYTTNQQDDIIARR